MNPVAELDGDGNVVARFFYGEKGHVPAYMVKDGAIYRIISDHLGSPRLVVTIDTGYVMQKCDYDTWGNVVLGTNPGFVPFGFAGGIEDNLSGLIRFGTRDYDCTGGRFISKDLVLFKGGINLFVYSSNNPINFIDPIGYWTMQIGLSITGGGGVGGTAGGGFIFGVNECTGEFQFGTYTFAGGGIYIGSGISGSADFTYSSNQNINEVSGIALTMGGSIGYPSPTWLGGGVEGNIPTD